MQIFSPILWVVLIFFMISFAVKKLLSLIRSHLFVLITQTCPTLCDPKDCQAVKSHARPARLLCPWDSLGKNTGLGCDLLLQVIFLTQGLNLSLMSPALHVDSLPLSHQVSLIILILIFITLGGGQKKILL